MSSAYLRLLIFLPTILIPACALSSLAFRMMYSACKLNRQGDNIQPWHSPFPILNLFVVPCLVLTVASWPAYRLTEAGKVVLYSRTISIINEAKVDVCLFVFFWDFLAFSVIQQMLAILSLVPLPFLNPAWTSGGLGSNTFEAWLGEFWALFC